MVKFPSLIKKKEPIEKSQKEEVEEYSLLLINDKKMNIEFVWKRARGRRRTTRAWTIIIEALIKYNAHMWMYTQLKPQIHQQLSH